MGGSSWFFKALHSEKKKPASSDVLNCEGRFLYTKKFIIYCGCRGIFLRSICSGRFLFRGRPG